MSSRFDSLPGRLAGWLCAATWLGLGGCYATTHQHDDESTVRVSVAVALPPSPSVAAPPPAAEAPPVPTPSRFAGARDEPAGDEPTGDLPPPGVRPTRVISLGYTRDSDLRPIAYRDAPPTSPACGCAGGYGSSRGDGPIWWGPRGDRYGGYVSNPRYGGYGRYVRYGGHAGYGGFRLPSGYGPRDGGYGRR